jgi:uncharacterized protein Yka (UPF0111/DUF47 family)
MPRIKYNYFDAFERQADFAGRAAALLTRTIDEFDGAVSMYQLTQMHELEHGADDENHELHAHIALEFVTPIEREDIIAMARYLDDIVDGIESVLQRMYMLNVKAVPPQALAMAHIIEKSCGSISAAMKDFRNFKRSKELNSLLIAVDDAEEEADAIYLEAVRDLYINHTDEPLYVMQWNNVFSRMESCCDACETAGTAMGTIILKNS